MNWVQVRHRLPEKFVKVLLYLPHCKGVILGELKDTGFVYADNNMCCNDEYVYDEGDITHWMHLPEIPGVVKVKVETKIHLNKCIPIISHDCWLASACDIEIRRSELGWDYEYCKLNDSLKWKCSDDCPLKESNES